MNSAALDVVGIGNAIVDVIAHADEAFLDAEGLARSIEWLVVGATTSERSGTRPTARRRP